MNSHMVTKHDGDWNEEIIGENLSFYEALSLVGNKRASRDGYYYRIGSPHYIKTDKRYLHHLK